MWNPDGVKLDAVAMSEERAAIICAHVDGAIDKYAGNLRRMQELIVSLYAGRVWETMGYESWQVFCAARFGPKLRALGIDFRREMVAVLGDAGLSTRAIGAAVGVDAKTVRNDLQVGTYSPPGDDATDRQVRNDYAPDSEHPPAPSKIVGMDRKMYTRTEPKTPKPRSEPVAWIKAKRAVMKVAEIDIEMSDAYLSALDVSDRLDMAAAARRRAAELVALADRAEHNLTRGNHE